MTDRRKVSLPYLFNKVARDEPITMLTCCDYPTAHIQVQAAVDEFLVGDRAARPWTAVNLS
jgi:ketopantoate hydroxymethyltransferase